MQESSLKEDESHSAGRFSGPPGEAGPLYPAHYSLVEYGSEQHNHHPQEEPNSGDELDRLEHNDDPDMAEMTSLIVEEVDLYVSENTAAHHTDEYETTEEDRPTGQIPQLVVRRGQPFEVRVKVNRPYQKVKDSIQVHLQIGVAPKVSKGTDQRLPVRHKLEPRKWSASLTSQEDDVIFLSVQASPRALVGRWRLSIETSLRTTGTEEEEEEEVRRYNHSEDVFILFNPWCKEDEVFLQDDTWRDEAVLNEAGRLYTGNHRQVASRPWNYGQFEDGVLECALDLLEKARLHLTVRYDPLRAVRAITSIVTRCSAETPGVLVAGWSGRYKGGTMPVRWSGSVAILDEFMHTGSPVKYGQCWVIAGVCTTLCRALGIPARTVTNFSSAHDCDGAVTVDAHWRHDGSPMDDHNQDHIWSFHSWNEAWMARSDLPPGYGGWQAFDATPQETSEGMRQAGPCSVAAIKDGYISFPRDGAMFYAEVNADKMHWVLLDDGTWRPAPDKARVGRRISTKQPRQKKAGKPFSRTSVDDTERLDITSEYKFKEDSEQHRTSVYRANLPATSTSHLSNPNDDVRFDFDLPTDITVGSNFELRLKMQNQSRLRRTASVNFLLSTAHYTGIIKRQLKRQTYDVNIGPIKTQEVVLRVGHEDYLSYIMDHTSFKVKAMVTVLETGQIFTSEDDFRLLRPKLNLQTPLRTLRQEETSVTVKLINPLPSHLTACAWRVEGAGIEKTRTVPASDVEPYETAEATLTIRPRRSGRRQLQVSFTSNELNDVAAASFIEIEE